MDFGDPVEALIPGVQGRVLTVLARTEAELTMRAIAELAGVSANQATVVLNRLVRLGLVERRDVGSAGLVSLIRDNEAARAVLMLADLQRGVLARLTGEARKIRPSPACLVVFGPFARREAHENSDIDVLAVPPPEAQVDDGRWTAALGQWTDRAARIAGNPVNLLEVTMDELPKLVRREGEPWRTIVEEGVVLIGAFPSEVKAG
ncbi:MAG TPA: MarR family transcriptional regulator [Acidimicrobiales bacterium]|nr:MarR family transcriptional regulator [Acidimicrobiales bacterium]